MRESPVETSSAVPIGLVPRLSRDGMHGESSRTHNDVDMSDIGGREHE